METKILLDPASETGAVRRLNGGNLGPAMGGAHAPSLALFKRLELPFTRLHDAPLVCAGRRIVDVPMIFGNPDADPEDFRNYYFTETDDWLRYILESGTKIVYRLGISIETGPVKYHTRLPYGAKKWADICSNIIRHYNEGAADGFHYGIEYFEIWNEPEFKNMWDGTEDEFAAFYAEAAAILKRRFPSVKIGGPAHGHFKPETERFIRFCAQHGAPLDFYSWHCYSDELYSDILTSPAKIRALLDAVGFSHTELHLNEWHYFSHDDLAGIGCPEKHAANIKKASGIDSAVFNAAILSLWQDTPLDLANYYTTSGGFFGVWKTPGTGPSKNFFGLEAFAGLARFPRRIAAVSDNKNVIVLAGKDAAGDCALLVSCFKSGAARLEIDTRGLVPRETLLLDSAHDLASVPFLFGDGKLQLETTGDSALFLIFFSRENTASPSGT